jgi:hypothetical protein
MRADERIVDTLEWKDAVLEFEPAAWTEEGVGRFNDWDVGFEAGC